MIKLKDLLNEDKISFSQDVMAKLHKDRSIEKYSHVFSFNNGGPGSGRHADDEDNQFDKEPSDDDLAAIEKEFEGVVKEGPSYEYAPYMKKIEKAENIQAKEVNKFVQLLMKKGLKKEATSVSSKYVKSAAEFDNLLKIIYRKLA